MNRSEDSQYDDNQYDDDFFDININARALVLVDNSVDFPTSTNDIFKEHGPISANDLLKIQIDVLDYMFSKKYNEKHELKFALATFSGEMNIRCSFTNDMNKLKRILQNFCVDGQGKLYESIKRGAASLIFNKNLKDVNRIICFIK